MSSPSFVGLRPLRTVVSRLVFGAVAGVCALRAQPAPDRTADALLARLEGSWQLTGTVRGAPVTYRGEGTRALRARYVELHLEDAATPSAYEARVLLGADTTPGRVLVHWLDSYGAAFSVPHGSGAVRGDTLQFTVVYRDGPFRDTFVFAADGRWTLHIEAGDRRGSWTTFARYTATPWPVTGPGLPPVAGTRRRIAALDVVDLTPGTGDAAVAGRCAYVHYTGRLLDGTIFDSSRDRAPDGSPRPPIAVPLGFRRVIAGWDAGFDGLRVGGTRRLIIPHPFAYGEAGRPPRIPPRSTLVFDVEVMAVTDTVAPREGDGRFPACPAWNATRGAPSLPLPPGGPLSAADTALVARILSAELQGNAAAPALLEGLAHGDPRLHWLAWRARARITDPRFSARDSLPAVSAAPAWPEPAWRLRLRALRPPQGACGPLRTALADSAWPVRFRAMALADSSCARDSVLVAALRDAVASLPRDAARRAAGAPSWHAAAYALTALARVAPGEALGRVAAHAAHAQWQVRAHAARAARVLRDTALLRRLSGDRHDNVAEVALEGVAALVGHADDARYLAALRRPGAPVVRVAATALAGSPDPRVAREAMAAFERWVARADASAHDVRVALLAAAGRPASDDRPPPRDTVLPPLAPALALGRDVRLRVTLADASGGGTFTVRLRGDVAPLMAARIAALAEAGYYNGLTWHRVEHDFVVQGGSPAANEYVGLPTFLRDELGPVPHPRGTVGMSTRGHDTGDAQWFVNLRDNRRLTRDYTVFAEVVDGMAVVDGVLEGDVIASIRVVSAPASPP